MTPVVARLLQDALALHRAGRLRDARSLYEQVLKREPRNFDALNLLAKLFLAEGDGLAAAERWRQALQVRPAFFEGRVGMVQALQQAGRLAEALEACREALLQRPDSVEILFQLGVLRRAQGQRAEALAAYRRCLELNPGLAEAAINVGCLLEEAGEVTQAREWFERAVAQRPALAAAHFFLGSLQRKMGFADAAESSLQEAVRLEPAYAAALNELGTLRSAQRRFGDAEAFFRRALAAQPRFAEAQNNLGNALRQQNRADEAVEAFERALALSPANAEILNNLGAAEQSRNRLEQAMVSFRKAIEVAPMHAEAHVNLGLCLLTLGRLREGWPEYDHRWRADLRTLRREFGVPAWTGVEPVRDKVVLLHAEQGLGDSIQFLRYVPHVAALGAKVVLEVQPELLDLLDGHPAVSHLCARGAPLPAFDLHCPLMDLPRAFGTTVETIPPVDAYLRARPPAIDRWRERLAALPRPWVGMVWSGNPRHRNDHNRSLSLPFLLAALEGFQGSLLSLQKEPRTEDLPRLRASTAIIDLSPEIRDFHDTSAVMAQLDLVLSVDTSVAHLAGALGRPTWVLLPFCPDWRWMLGREDSPWYPGMRLLRQASPGDWTAPLREVRARLVDRVPPFDR